MRKDVVDVSSRRRPVDKLRAEFEAREGGAQALGLRRGKATPSQPEVPVGKLVDLNENVPPPAPPTPPEERLELPAPDAGLAGAIERAQAAAAASVGGASSPEAAAGAGLDVSIVSPLIKFTPPVPKPSASPAVRSSRGRYSRGAERNGSRKSGAAMRLSSCSFFGGRPPASADEPASLARASSSPAVCGAGPTLPHGSVFGGIGGCPEDAAAPAPSGVRASPRLLSLDPAVKAAASEAAKAKALFEGLEGAAVSIASAASASASASAASASAASASTSASATATAPRGFAFCILLLARSRAGGGERPTELVGDVNGRGARVAQPERRANLDQRRPVT